MTKVFISYSHQQGEWVWDRLVPVLKAGGVEVLIDRERFEAGKSVLGQMNDTQDQAQQHLLVLSPDYLDSKPCRHEMNRAIDLDPNFDEGIVIPVVRVDCKLPNRIKRPNPLYVDVRDDNHIENWDKLLAAFDADLSTRKIADLVYTALLAAGTHFSSGNGNLLEAGSDLDVASLAAAIVAMMTQRDEENNDLDIVPRVLLVPPELRTTAQAVLESEFLERAVSESAGVDNLPTGNPLRKTVKLEVESRLSNTAKFANASTMGWYLFGGPLDMPMIVGFLSGTQVPTIEFFGLDSDPNTLGVSWRIYHDFGSAMGDPKSGVRATGAGGS